MFHASNHREFTTKGIGVAAVLLALFGGFTAYAAPAPLVLSTMTGQPPTANFLGENPSNDARRVADWAMASGDTTGLPFIIVDKIQAKVFVFDGVGQLRGATSALLGMAHSDDTVPGIGNRKLSSIRPEERTTAAGRFVATLGHDFHEDILWIDYDSALALHRVAIGKPSDRRLQRLATASADDKRVSYGCVNVPVKFYEDIVVRAFTGTSGIVYILPETKSIEDVFAMPAIAKSEVGKDAQHIASWLPSPRTIDLAAHAYP